MTKNWKSNLPYVPRIGKNFIYWLFFLPQCVSLVLFLVYTKLTILIYNQINYLLDLKIKTHIKKT